MNVLYIEDDVDVALAVMDALQAEQTAGYQFTHTYDAETAWSKLQDQQFDLILTDLNLPNMTGLELIQKTRETFPDSKIVGLSGFIEPDEVDRIKLLGADLVLLKPITPAELDQALRSLG
jgi:Response regulator containing CheY-like receiver domain and AraC-type DNA-binding domain